MKKTAVLALILVCLMASGVVCIRPVKAQYQGDITINADGSVIPSTAPIQQTGNIYTLTSDLDGALDVDRSNMILDGNGYSISAAQVNGVLNVTVENFIITGGGQFGVHLGVFTGISLSDTSNVVVANNTVTGISNFLAVFEYYETVAGIIVAGGRSNIISGNNLANNWEGMYFSDTSYNLIVGNNITSNATASQGYNEPGGIYFDHSSNNTIYHNNFEINVGGEAGDSYYNSVNVWDDGYPFGGNYWSDYQAKYPNTAEIDNSGIGNTPYIIDELDAALANNTDRYPLMEPFNSTFYALQTTPPKISLLSPLNQTYSESNVSLTFSINKEVNWIGYSLDGQQNVTITGNTTITKFTNGLHTLTVYANDTFGNMGASSITFTIALPIQAAPVGAVSGAVVVVVVGAGLFVYFKERKQVKLHGHE